jgi:formylglycine-generating enzyme
MNLKYAFVIYSIALPLFACAQKDSTSAATPAASTDTTTTAANSNTDAAARLVKKSKDNMVFVQGGVFQMGDFGRKHGPDKLPHNPPYAFSEPMHEVELDSFSMSKYKVTYDEFDVYTAAVGRPKIAQAFFDLESRKIQGAPAGTNWQDAKDYCLWLAKESGLPFDLPTEAQWEYAARNRGEFVLFATVNGEFEKGKNVPSYEQFKEIKSVSDTIYGGYVYPVGKFPPTPLGLYDMTGNGTDWMNDWFDKDYYAKAPRKNPKGPDTGIGKVIRGIELDYSTGVTTYRRATLPIQEISVDKDTKQLTRTVTPTLNFRCAVQSPKTIKP